MKKIILLTLTCLMLISCKTDEPVVSNEIIGLWKWQTSYRGGITGTHSTPDSQMTLDISETDMVSTTISNKIVVSSISFAYQLIDKQNQGLSTIFKVKMNDGKMETITVTKNDALFENETFSSSYKRIN